MCLFVEKLLSLKKSVRPGTKGSSKNRPVMSMAIAYIVFKQKSRGRRRQSHWTVKTRTQNVLSEGSKFDDVF